MLEREVRLELLAGGYCTHPEAMVLRGAPLKSCRFPALFAHIEHPTHGSFLYDTGYAAPFFDQTRRLPGSLYAKITPVTLDPSERAAAQLARRGIAPEQVQGVILSHFHGDHIAGLRDFPRANFYFLPSAYAAVRDRSGLRALLRGFLPGLLPPDFELRARPVHQTVALPSAFRPFERGFDLLGDGSLIGVELPGHAAGQLGLLARSEGAVQFLCADAAWSTQAIEELRFPNPLTYAIMDDRRAYGRTLRALHTLSERQPEIRLIPSHCPRVWASLVA